MPISGNIFQTKEAAAAVNNDDAGRFRSGYQMNNRPVSLDAFRVTSGDPLVADRVAELLGATKGPREWETKSGETIEVFTEANEVEVILDGPGSVRTTLVLWSRKGGKVMESDGWNLIEEGKVTSKPDPDRDLPLAERKAKANEGTGPGPSLQLYFRLEQEPSLGKFKYYSGSWSSMQNFSEAEEALTKIGGPAKAVFGLERVEFTVKSTGENRSFVKPYVKVIGPADDVEESF